MVIHLSRLDDMHLCLLWGILPSVHLVQPLHLLLSHRLLLHSLLVKESHLGFMLFATDSLFLLPLPFLLNLSLVFYPPDERLVL